MEATGPRLCRYRNANDVMSIYAIADIHRGARGCSLEQLREDIRKIRANPKAAWVLVGDYCDFIAPGDKRYDPSCVDEDLKVNELGRLASLLIGKTVEDLRPIAGRCLGAGMGNHEVSYLRLTLQQEIHEDLCRMLGTHNLMFSGWFDIFFEHAPRMRQACEWVLRPDDKDCGKRGQVRLRVFQHHGFSAAQSPGGRINVLHKLLTNFDADLIMIGHLHEQFIRARAVLTPDIACRRILQRGQVGMITGTYLKTYEPGFSSYGEIKGHAPAVLGATRAMFKPSTMELTAENRVVAGVRC